MENRRSLYKRTLRVLLPVVILAGIIIGSCQIQRAHIKADNGIVYVKAKVVQMIEDNSGGQPFSGAQKVKARITSGQYRGLDCELDNSNSYQRGAFCTNGTKVIAVIKDIDGTLTGAVYNYDRTMMVYVLLGLFSLSLVLVGGKKGAASLYRYEWGICCTYYINCYSGGFNIHTQRFFVKNYMRYNRNINRYYNIRRTGNDCRKYVTFKRI